MCMHILTYLSSLYHHCAQLLDYSVTHGICFYGTVITKDLRKAGYEGFVCICTASVDLISAEGVDLIIEKSSIPETADAIKAAYTSWQRRKHAI